MWNSSCTVTIFCLIVHPLPRFSPSAVLHLEWSTVHDLMGPDNCHLASWSQFSCDKILIVHSYRTWKAGSSLSLHPFQVEPFTIPNLKRCPFKWQCHTNSPITCLNWFLFSSSSLVVVLLRTHKGNSSHVSVRVWAATAPGVFSLSSLSWSI